MKIAGAALQLESSHSTQQNLEITESLRVWAGDRRPDFEGREPARATARQQAARVQLSDAGKTAQSSEADAISQGIEAAENDPRLRLIRAMIAILTGREVKVFDATELKSSAPPVDIQTPTGPEKPRQQCHKVRDTASNMSTASLTPKVNRRDLRQTASSSRQTAGR